MNRQNRALLALFFFCFLLTGCTFQKKEKNIDLQNISSSSLQTIGPKYSVFMTDGKMILCYDIPKQEEINNSLFVLIDGKNYGRVISNVDISKFKIIDNYFAKDDISVYYSCQPLIGSDPQTYKLLSKGYGFGVDKNNVYRLNFRIDGADPKSFKSLGDDYGKDNRNVFYLENKLIGADVFSFSFLANNYSKDKNNVYYMGKVLTGADPKTLTVLGKGYFKDKSQVYFQGKVVSGMDPKTAVFLGYMYYAKDKDFIYYNENRIEGSDSKSFEYFGSYIKDKTGIYVEGKRFNNFDDKTVKYIGFQFYKDKDRVYRNGLVISSEPDSFELIEKLEENGNNYYMDVYAKDKDSVFYGSKHLEKLNPDSTKFLLDKNNNPVVTDGYCTYRMDTLLECE